MDNGVGMSPALVEGQSSLYSGVMQSLWSSLLDTWPYGDRALFTVLMFAAHAVVTLPSMAVGLALHVWQPEAISEFKIQQGRVPSAKLVRQCVLESLFSTFVTNPLSNYFVMWPLFTYLGMEMRAPLPSLSYSLYTMLLTGVLSDFIYYWIHRLFHAVPWLYKNIHKKHHLFIAPISFSGEFLHPVEAIAFTFCATYLGNMLLKSHLAVVILWTAVRTVEPMISHSGYAFPWDPVRRHLGWFADLDGHDWHHSHNKGMYGIIPWWDRLFGTDLEYKKWQQKQALKKECASCLTD